MLEDRTTEAQQILEELYSEEILPFKLMAHQVDHVGSEEYIVRFHDSRLRSIDLSWCENQSFKDVFRTAVLERIARMNGIVQRVKAS